MLRGFKLCVVGSWLALVSLAMAQDSRPLRLVVPYPSGGILDMQARLIAPALRQQLQREVFIDNVAGAAGAIGLQHVLSAPEGSELVLGTDSDVVLAPLFNTELRHRPHQFRLLAVLGSAPMALVARPGFHSGALDGLIAGDGAPKGGLRLASYGIGSNGHLLAEDFARRLGLQWMHVPYRGFAPMLQDLLSGTVDAAFVPFAAGVPDLIRASKLSLLGVAATQRIADAPSVPTFQELGLPGFVHRSWSALLVPASAGAGTTAGMRAAAQEAVADPEVRRKLAAIGLAALPLTQDEEAQAFVDAEVARYRSLLAALPSPGRAQAP
jgi:tripartite-type tricarboxylate transporter receptor subunit TctC